VREPDYPSDAHCCRTLHTHTTVAHCRRTLLLHTATARTPLLEQLTCGFQVRVAGESDTAAEGRREGELRVHKRRQTEQIKKA
jgi:hypothetical protein